MNYDIHGQKRHAVAHNVPLPTRPARGTRFAVHVGIPYRVLVPIAGERWVGAGRILDQVRRDPGTAGRSLRDWVRDLYDGWQVRDPTDDETAAVHAAIGYYPQWSAADAIAAWMALPDVDPYTTRRAAEILVAIVVGRR